LLVRLLLTYAKPQARPLALATLLTLLGSAVGLAQPIAAQRVVESISAATVSCTLVAVLLALVVVAGILDGIGMWWLEVIAERTALVIRQRLATTIIWAKVASVERLAPGDIVSRITADTAILKIASTSAVANVVTGLLGFVGAIVLMFWLSTQLFLVTLVVLVLVAVAIFAILPRIQRSMAQSAEAVGDLGSAIERIVNGFTTVKANVAERKETSAISAVALRAFRAGRARARLTAISNVSMEMLGQVSFLAVLGVGGALVSRGSISLAELIAFLLYIRYLSGPITLLQVALAGFQQGIVAAHRVRAVEAIGVEEDVAAVAGRRSWSLPDVELRNISFSYDGRKELLRNISLRAEPFSVTAIVGPSGGGKSTIFRLVCRFYEPTGGQILIGGQDVASTSRSELRAEVALVEQEATLMAGSFYENLTYGSGDRISARDIEEVLELTGLVQLVHDLPDGMRTELGSRGAGLSGGERQRLAIARALLRRPSVLLLDEVTAQLDTRNEVLLTSTIKAAAKQCTVLLVAHRLSTVVSADRVVVLDRGAVRAVGSHQRLISDDELYRELVVKQLGEAATT
jgi:ABC-type multidrug transport system fused ATPase/permease subunit